MGDDMLYVLRHPCATCPDGKLYSAEPFTYGCYRTSRGGDPCGRPDEVRHISLMAGEIANGIKTEDSYRLREKISDGVAEVLARAMKDVGGEFDREMFRWSCDATEDCDGILD